MLSLTFSEYLLWRFEKYVCVIIMTLEINNDENVDILEILENYAQSKVDASGFGFERIVFSYLDYLIYRDGYSFKETEIVRPLADDWQFQF